MADIVIIGGGVIGLTSAYELARNGAKVHVVDRQQVGREASWAGAGMLPPGQPSARPAVRHIAAASHRRWPELSSELLQQTDIDNGFRPCGALQVSLENRDSLQQEVAAWNAIDVPAQLLDAAGLSTIEKRISPSLTTGYLLPTMAQVRNPWHLKALKAACLQLGVTIQENYEVCDFNISSSKVNSITDGKSAVTGNQFLVTSGAWSGKLGEKLNCPIEVAPVRGQIVLLKLPEPIFTHIIEDGPKYLVPREDGHVLIGSTEEHVGFVKENTAAGVQGLLNFAHAVVPELQHAEMLKTWSGLRPWSKRGYPYIGCPDSIENLTLATGHFRDGLSQSPGTAQLLCELMTGQPTSIPIEELSL